MSRELSKGEWVAGLLSFGFIGLVLVGIFTKSAAAQPKKFNHFRSMPH